MLKKQPKKWQIWRIKNILFIKTIQGFIISLHLRLIIFWEKKYYKLYTSVNRLPLTRFFDILNTNDYRYLLKLKNYDNLPKIKMDLSEIWANIYEDFLIKSDNKEYKYRFNQRKNIDLLIVEYEQLRYSLWVAGLKYDEDILKFLKSKGINIDYKDYKGSFEKGKSKFKSLEYKIKFKRKEFEENNSSIKNESTYEQIIDDIEKYKGHQIDIEKTTVLQFITYLNGLKKQIENARRKNPKGRHIK